MDNRDIYRYTRQFVGGDASVFAYYNSNKSKSIDIMTSTNTMFTKVDVYSTIGLSETDIGLKAGGRNLGVELIGVGDKGDEITANIVATVAFDIMDEKDCFWGKVFPNVVSEYDITYDSKHVVLLTPVFWQDYQQFEDDEKVVAWLLVVPISDAEKSFIEKRGINAFEDILARQGTDITDRKRKSFV